MLEEWCKNPCICPIERSSVNSNNGSYQYSIHKPSFSAHQFQHLEKQLFFGLLLFLLFLLILLLFYSFWCGKDIGVLFWRMNPGPSRGIQPGGISDICLIVIQSDFPSTRSLIVSVWQKPIQKDEMSSGRIILSLQLSTHNYLDSTGLRDIVKEHWGCNLCLVLP